MNEYSPPSLRGVFIRLFDLPQFFAAFAFARFVRNRVARTAGAAITDIKPFQTYPLYGLPAAALCRIRLVKFAVTVLAACAENSLVFFDLQDMHRNKVIPASALPRLR